MARTINQSFLLGNLGGDAEFRTLASGEEVATLRLATSRSYRRADGEWADETEWHDVVVWKADRLRDHRGRLQKGGPAHIAGEAGRSGLARGRKRGLLVNFPELPCLRRAGKSYNVPSLPAHTESAWEREELK